MTKLLNLVLVLIFCALPMVGSARSLLPIVPEPKEKAGPDGCVRPEDDMKKNHMKYLLHQRDKTMHQGIRTKTFSLEQCINCHVMPDEKTGVFPSHTSSKHFCKTCHAYAGVSIDCFECHADKPGKTPTKTSLIPNDHQPIVMVPRHGK